MYKRFQVYGRSRVRDKSVKVYVGTFATQREAEAADEQHRVTQRGIKADPQNVESVCGDTVLARTNAPRDLRNGGWPRHDEPSQLGEISVLDEVGRRLVLVVVD